MVRIFLVKGSASSGFFSGRGHNAPDFISRGVSICRIGRRKKAVFALYDSKLPPDLGGQLGPDYPIIDFKKRDYFVSLFHLIFRKEIWELLFSVGIGLDHAFELTLIKKLNPSGFNFNNRNQPWSNTAFYINEKNGLMTNFFLIELSPGLRLFQQKK